MKKFVKVSSITALVLFVLGIILVAICTFGGGAKTLRQLAMEGRLNLGGRFLFNWVEDWTDYSWEGHYDLEDSTIFNGEYAVNDSTNVSFSADKSEVTALSAELGGCDVYISTAADGKYYVSTTGSGKFQVYVKNGVLHVKGVKKSYQMGKCRVDIYIPEDVILNSAYLSMGAGQMDIEKLAATDTDIEVGAGALYVDNLQTKNLNVELGAGEMFVYEGKIGSMDLAVSAGNMEISAEVAGDIDAEVAMGYLEIFVNGSNENSHNYNMECAAGSMTVGSLTHTGLAVERYIDNGAATTYNLECSMGELIVDFEY